MNCLIEKSTDLTLINEINPLTGREKKYIDSTETILNNHILNVRGIRLINFN